MSHERVLIVGGAGYIGSHAAKAVRLAGREPVVFDDLSCGHEHAVRWGPLVKGDIRNADAVRAAIREHKPSAVMQFAARIEVGEGEKDPAHFYDNNVAGTLNLVRVMLEEGVKNLVFSSTCAIYGNPDRLPLTEDLPKRPVSVYGRTKLMCEQVLEDISRAHGLNFAALRYFNAAGADPDGEIGEEHDPETHLIPNALKAAVGLGGPMKLFGTDYPRARFFCGSAQKDRRSDRMTHPSDNLRRDCPYLRSLRCPAKPSKLLLGKESRQLRSRRHYSSSQ